MSKDAFDLTVRELLGLLGVQAPNVDVPNREEVDFDMTGTHAVQRIFAEIHPTNAGKVVRAIAYGLDVGYTAQGGYHPDFQRALESERRDPEDRFTSDTKLRERTRWW